MSVKQITIVTPGGDVSAQVPLEPETTVADALKAAGLDRGFCLSVPGGEGLFQPDDKLDALVEDGATLHANPWADVGSLDVFYAGLLRTAQCARVTTQLAWKIIVTTVKERREHSRPSPDDMSGVNTGHRPYWQRAGWRASGTHYTGHYRVGEYALPGKIAFRSKWDQRFEVLTSHNLINACGEHRRCFVPLRNYHPPGRRWFSVHFNRRPQTLSSGILALQKLLSIAAATLEEKTI